MTTEAYSGYGTWKQWAPESFGACDSQQAAYFAAEIARANFGNLAGARVLEIGFGNGAFADWCRKRGCNYSGTEVIQELVARGRDTGFDMHVAGLSLDAIAPHGTVDLVAAWDVFEHIEIESLRDVLLGVKAVLRQGGQLLARFPSGDSPFSRSIQYGDLTHRTILGSSAVRQLAGEVGLRVEQIREPSFAYKGLPLVTTVRRLAVEFARRIAYPFLANVFMGGGAPVLTPNMVVVLVRE